MIATLDDTEIVGLFLYFPLGKRLISVYGHRYTRLNLDNLLEHCCIDG
jgi:hypothetical protein|tara:strand:- start:777 stop:920 length:144 start_codon:yes stop_codon:yes gene_type:complete